MWLTKSKILTICKTLTNPLKNGCLPTFSGRQHNAILVPSSTFAFFYIYIYVYIYIYMFLFFFPQKTTQTHHLNHLKIGSYTQVRFIFHDLIQLHSRAAANHTWLPTTFRGNMALKLLLISDTEPCLQNHLILPQLHLRPTKSKSLGIGFFFFFFKISFYSDF